MYAVCSVIKSNWLDLHPEVKIDKEEEDMSALNLVRQLTNETPFADLHNRPNNLV